VCTCLCKVLSFPYDAPVMAAVEVLGRLAERRAELLTPQLHSLLDSCVALFAREAPEEEPHDASRLVMARQCDALLERQAALHCDVKSLMQVRNGRGQRGMRLTACSAPCKPSTLQSPPVPPTPATP